MTTEAICGVVFGIVGAAVGVLGAKVHKKRKNKNKNAVVATTTDNAAAAAAATVPPQPKKKKYVVLEVGTDYLDPRHSIVPPLKNFRSHLQFAPEIESFERVVQHIDKLVGMFLAVNGKDRGGRGDWDVWAAAAQTFIDRQIDEIITYNGSNTVSPSETKSRDIKMYGLAIKESVAQTVEEITRAQMAQPFYNNSQQ
jgi:hypothetical protein